MTKLKQPNKVLRKFISLPILRIACSEAVFASTLYQIKRKWGVWRGKIALNLVRFFSLCFVIVIKILSVKKCYNYTQKLLMKETWEQWGEKKKRSSEKKAIRKHKTLALDSDRKQFEKLGMKSLLGNCLQNDERTREKSFCNTTSTHENEGCKKCWSREVGIDKSAANGMSESN